MRTIFLWNRIEKGVNSMNYSSHFAKHIQSYLTFRESRGFKAQPYEKQLAYFDCWCAKNHPDAQELSREIVFQWINEEEPELIGVRARVTSIRMFGEYLNAIGDTAYVLPKKYTTVSNSTAAYVFTDEELAALFSSIDTLPASPDEPFMDVIAPVMYRMIYTCGLRPNEGRELLTENVDLSTGTVLITHTKMHKERLVYMSDDMLTLAREYDIQRRIICNGSQYFFPSVSGSALSSQTVYAFFNRAWASAALPSGNIRKARIRVYDLRHRFATACLCKWLDAGENLLAMLPYLRQYMGHTTLAQTAYYIHILPENLLQTSQIDWAMFENMFPEVSE